ncbi:MAG: hypothetical protein ACYDCP_08425 [Thermoplasmataceae archaeon]
MEIRNGSYTEIRGIARRNRKMPVNEKLSAKIAERPSDVIQITVKPCSRGINFICTTRYTI